MEAHLLLTILSFSPLSLPAMFLAVRTKKKKFLGNIFNKHYAIDLFQTGKPPFRSLLEVYFKVLGIKKDTSMEAITKRYKVLIKEYHPDRLQGLGLPKEFIQLANKKLASINEAYSAVKNEKKIK